MITTPGSAEQPWSGYDSPAEFWQDLYRPSLGTVWAGRVNPVLAEVVGDDATDDGGHEALDLGCGQGGDALWLARRGWRVLAVDIADAAVERVRAQAAAEGLGDLITARRLDLADVIGQDRDELVTRSNPAGFDLISAQYLQTPFAFPRAAALRALAEHLRPDGRLVIVDHASSAPWSWKTDHDFPSPEQTLAELALDPGRWATEICAARERTASGPGGQTATVTDNVICLRRLPAQAQPICSTRISSE